MKSTFRMTMTALLFMAPMAHGMSYVKGGLNWAWDKTKKTAQWVYDNKGKVVATVATGVAIYNAPKVFPKASAIVKNNVKSWYVSGKAMVGRLCSGAKSLVVRHPIAAASIGAVGLTTAGVGLVSLCHEDANDAEEGSESETDAKPEDTQNPVAKVCDKAAKPAPKAILPATAKEDYGVLIDILKGYIAAVQNGETKFSMVAFNDVLMSLYMVDPAAKKEVTPIRDSVEKTLKAFAQSKLVLSRAKQELTAQLTKLQALAK